jgi:hypothetical protein
MKHVIAILLIVVFIAAGFGVLAYVRSTKQGTAVSVVQTETPVVTATPQPLPTVSQILLTVSGPVNGSTVTTSSVSVKGITTPKAEVFINDKSVIADALGSFSVPVTLDEGENTIVIAANDSNGNYSEQDLIVSYDSGQ